LEITSSRSMNTVLSGDIPFRALDYSEQGSQLFLASQPTWYFILLFLLIGSIAVSQLFFGNLLKGTFQAAIRYSVTVGVYNDNSQVQRQKDNILYAVYFVSVAFFLHLMEIRFSLFPFKTEGFSLLLLNIVFLAAIFYLKIMLVNFLAFIFNQIKLFREYLYHSFTINKLFGLLILPMIFLLTYSRGSFHEACFYITASLFGAMLSMKIIKGIVFSMEKRVFSFYLLLKYPLHG